MLSFREYHCHLPHFQVQTKQSIDWLYLVRVFFDLLGKTVFLFVPLYLYQLGSQAAWVQQLGWSFLEAGLFLYAVYFLGGRAVVVMAALPAARWCQRFGTDQVISWSFLVNLVTLSGLWLASWSVWWLGLAMVGLGLRAALFSGAYSTLFSETVSQKPLGQDVSMVQFLLQVVSVLAPLLGGIVIAVQGYHSLFLIGSLLSMGGWFVATNVRSLKPKHVPSWSELRAWTKDPGFDKKLVAFAGRHLHEIAIALWPLYVFLIVGTAERVGFLYSFSLFLALLLTFMTGFYIDHRQRTNRPFYLTGGMLSLLWLLRVNITSFWSIAVVDTFDRITSSVHWLLYDARFIGDGKGRKALAYFTYREVIVSVCAMVFWLGVIGVFLVAGGWTVIFVMAAIGVLLSLLLQDHRLN